MSDEVSIEEAVEPLPLEEIPSGDDAALDNVIPQMNLPAPRQEENLISDEALLDVYKEIMDDIRDGSKQIDYFIDNFAEMVVNGGDATGPSKEALVNLVKMKADQADKKTKIADLMTRLKMKQPDTFPKYLAAQQNNTINIQGASSKRALLESIKKAKNKDKK